VLVAFAESILPRLRQKRHRRSTRDNGWDSEGYNCSLSMWIYGAFSRSMALVTWLWDATMGLDEGRCHKKFGYDGYEKAFISCTSLATCLQST
jgi:hypothetical protein